MGRAIAVGRQDFADIIKENCFYVDKTLFIKEWWESQDEVTLITRPRRFGKTLNMNMLEKFFSVKYAGREDLFGHLAIWREEKFRQLQGTFPVIFFSFADIKETTYQAARQKICQKLALLYEEYRFLMKGDFLSERERGFFEGISVNMEDYQATLSLKTLSGYLYRYYGKKVIILLDEYDTPMQEAYVNGYWEELAAFTRSLFNSTFKTNVYLERAVMTGITRVSRESIFSDLNNLKVVTTTSEEYADCFGFTEQEVRAALQEYGLLGEAEQVKYWYDGFTFGSVSGIYNPWSIINYLDTGKLKPYWANTSTNRLAGQLICGGSPKLKEEFEDLISGKTLCTQIDEQIVYDQLDEREDAVWSLLLAGGYLKVKQYQPLITEYGEWQENYVLQMTNFEVKTMFRSMIRGWFSSGGSGYNEFVKALLADDLEAMNVYMNRVALSSFSYFDTGRTASGSTEAERFYHGFVLGLIVELTGRYIITSNRESGFGRYDVMLEPREEKDNGIIIEFKVHDPESEKSLQATAQNALAQIEKKNYCADLQARGIAKERIREYGFAFAGKRVLIQSAGRDIDKLRVQTDK